ncbi:MAG: nicotinamide riboside transporter PnuC, partial [Pseudomonadota bacterium]|nr:nicotinamide riboside transporter PnuC [Pseudomonadota bacterium]
MIEAVAVLFGVVYIGLAIRQHRACWIAGAASTALYSVVFLQSGLPLQAGLQLLYVALSVYGWIQWRPAAGASQRPVSWPWPRHGLALAAVAIATAISTALLMRYGGSTAPFADSLGTWASVFATWLLARRYLESWLWWIVIDLGLAALFLRQGLLPTAALYLAYALLAGVGWRAWRRASNAGDDARLEAVIAELGMHRPERIPLPGGLANRAIRLRDAGQDVVVRIAGAEGSALGADRESERAMHQLAAGIGLAPQILIARPAEGLLVTRHAAGRMLTQADLREVAMLRRIGAWLARLHAEEPPPSLRVVDFGARAAGYLSTVLA